MSEQVLLVKNNVHFLQQGIELLNDLDDLVYQKTDPPVYQSSIGKHMRHILDHYQSLIKYKDNRIDYDTRERDERIETDKTYATSVANQIIENLNIFLTEPLLLGENIMVRSNEGEETQNKIWSESTIKREFQFLLSHTVHHYALIAIILRIEGYKPDKEFGVAPSTLRFQKEEVTKTAG